MFRSTVVEDDDWAAKDAMLEFRGTGKGLRSSWDRQTEAEEVEDYVMVTRMRGVEDSCFSPSRE